MLFTSGLRTLGTKESPLRQQKGERQKRRSSKGDLLDDHQKHLTRRHTCAEVETSKSHEQSARLKASPVKKRSLNWKNQESARRSFEQTLHESAVAHSIAEGDSKSESAAKPDRIYESRSCESTPRKGRLRQSLSISETMFRRRSKERSMSTKDPNSIAEEVLLVSTGGGPPAMPPPPLPTEMTSSHSGGGFSNGSFHQPPPPQLATHQDSADVYEDDWSDDESVDQEAGGARKVAGSSRSRDESTEDEHRSVGQTNSSGTGRFRSGSRTSKSSENRDDESREDSISNRQNNYGPPTDRGSKLSTGEGPARGGTVKKNMFRFSQFVKSGTEGYILNQGSAKVSTQPSEKHEVIFTGIQVSRRYKHFDWLHQRLTEKYAILPIPPLPDKTVTGRFEEDLIEHRMQLLQLWVAKVCRHPVLSHSDVWVHFLTCTDDKKWKQGKRKAEKDDFTGGNFFLTLTVPAQPLDQNDVEQKVDSFDRMTKSLNNSVHGLHSVAMDSAKKMAGPYKREWQKMGNAITALGLSFEMDQNASSQTITQAVKKTADCYMTVGRMFEEQPRKDLEPLMDNLFAYKGMLATVPDIVQVHRSASQKLRDHDKMMQEGKISQSEADSIRQRVDTISYSMLAEMNHFQEERVTDFKETMSTFLESQIAFYQQVVGQLQDSLQQYK